MNTNIRVENNKIIFDGHASNLEQCNVITNICNALSSNENFKTLKYEDGYAEFEILNQASDLKFAAAPAYLTLVFDSGVESVSFYDRDGLKAVSTSGRTIETVCNDGQIYTFTIVPKKLYKTTSVSANLGSGEISPYVDDSNQIYVTAGVGGIDGTITITSRKDKRIVKPKVKNPDGSYDTLIIQQAENATNAEVANTINNIKIEQDENGVLKVGDIIIPQKKLLWDKLVYSNASDYPESVSYLFKENIKAGDTLEIHWSTNLITPTEDDSFTISKIKIPNGFVDSSYMYPNLHYLNLSFTSNVRTIVYNGQPYMRLGRTGFNIKAAVAIALNSPTAEGGNVVSYYTRQVNTCIRKIYKIIE